MLQAIEQTRSLKPWNRHGALRISPDGRKFCHADGTPFFWLGDTAWEIGTRMEFDDETVHGRGIEWYLDRRAAGGFNVVQIPLITPLTGLFGRNVRGERIVTADAFDPENLNEEYLTRFDRILDLLEARGLYAALLPTWGDIIGNGLMSAESAERFGHVIAERYARRPNLIWMLGGDIDPAGKEAVWNALATGIQGVLGDVLMTYHPKGAQSSSAYALGNWLNFHSIQSSHSDPKNCHPAGSNFNPHIDRLAHDYALTPPRPTLNTEPPYEGITIDLKHEQNVPREGAYEISLAAYWGVLGGGAGHTFGHNNIWQAYDFDHGYEPQFGADDCWENSVETVGAQQMTILRSLILSRPFAGLQRCEALIANSAALNAGKTASSCMAARGDGYALCYSGAGLPLEIDFSQLDSQHIAAWWFDPRCGAALRIGEFKSGGRQTFSPPGAPGDGNDWVLVLDDADADFGPPGVECMQPPFVI